MKTINTIYLALIILSISCQVISQKLPQQNIEKPIKQVHSLQQFELQALTLLQNMHPQLKQYQLLGITELPKSSSIEVHSFSITIQSPKDNIIVIAIVSVDQNGIENDVIFQKFNKKSQTITEEQDNSDINANDTAETNVSDVSQIGSYRKFYQFSDPRYSIALKFLLTQHPNLQNYWLMAVDIQIVGGTVFNFVYLSENGRLFIIAKVFVNLKNKCKMVQFIFKTPDPDSQKDTKKEEIYYYSQQAVLKEHPQIKNFSIIERIIEREQKQQKIVIITYQNTDRQLRSLAEIVIEWVETDSSIKQKSKLIKKEIRVTSFYTYSF